MKLLFQEKIRSFSKRSVTWLKPRLVNLLASCEPQLTKIRAWLRPRQEKFKVWAAPLKAQGLARWQSLARREKHLILSGTVTAAILLLYALIWSPLNNQLDELRTQIQAEKSTYAWLQAADKQLRSLENKQGPVSAKTLSLRLNAAQEMIQQGPLSKNLTQLTQSTADEIHCVFDSVDFDKLSTWLMEFSGKQAFFIKQASIRRLNNVGLVQAEFVFRAAH